VNNQRPLNELSVDEFKSFSPLFQSDVLHLFNWQAALKHRDLPGGTGPDSVAHQLKTARDLVRT
jgi:argininosuccinate lyase